MEIVMGRSPYFDLVVTLIMRLIGFVGIAFISMAAVPQLVKSWRTKRTTDLSLTYWLSLLFGLTCAFIYSTSVRDVVFMIGNGVSIILAGLQTTLMVYFRRKYDE
ncbi:MAG: SemiSWEET family sugar transporter [Candidatus Thorarchaeota archaeon]